MQQEFLNDLEKENDKLEVINKYINKIAITDINDEILESINPNECNIYIEFLTREFIYKKHAVFVGIKANKYLILFYISYYHPKMYEYLFDGKNAETYQRDKNEILKITMDLEKTIFSRLTTEHKKIYENLKKKLKIDINSNISKMTAFEYCFFITWAKFDYKFVDVPKDYIIKHNENDILTINATYNLKNLDSIVMYNNVINKFAPILTEELIKQTKRYHIKPIKNIAIEPITLYNKNFEKIQSLNSKVVTVLIDYGNNYFTKLFLGKNTEISLNFANNIINRKIISNFDHKMLKDIINKDIFDFLPIQCYAIKENKQKLLTEVNTMKKIIIGCYSDDKKIFIKNIINSNEIKQLLNEKEYPIFAYYVSFLLSMDKVTLNTAVEYCSNYIYDNAI